MRNVVAVVLDVAMVLAFVITAWPYVVATIVGSLIALGLSRRAPQKPTGPYGWPTGLIVLVVTVVLGMVLRLITGGTAAWPFWIVAFVTLAILLLGWRLVARVVVRSRARTHA